MLEDLYRLTPKEQKPDFLVRVLASPDPAARAAGTRMARRDAERGVPLPDPVRAASAP